MPGGVNSLNGGNTSGVTTDLDPWELQSDPLDVSRPFKLIRTGLGDVVTASSIGGVSFPQISGGAGQFMAIDSGGVLTPAVPTGPTTSAALAATLSDETGTGLVVFNESPTFENVVVSASGYNLGNAVSNGQKIIFSGGGGANTLELGGLTKVTINNSVANITTQYGAVLNLENVDQTTYFETKEHEIRGVGAAVPTMSVVRATGFNLSKIAYPGSKPVLDIGNTSETESFLTLTASSSNQYSIGSSGTSSKFIIADGDYTSSDIILEYDKATSTVGTTKDVLVGGALEMTSTTDAFTPPKQTTTQLGALSAVAGNMIYNSSSGLMNYYNGTEWIELRSGAAVEAISTTFVLTDFDTPVTSGSVDYQVEGVGVGVSSDYGLTVYEGWGAFDQAVPSNRWVTPSSFGGAGFTYDEAFTLLNADGTLGEWLILSMSNLVTATSYQIETSATTEQAIRWKVYSSSNSGASWTVVDDQTGADYTWGTPSTTDTGTINFTTGAVICNKLAIVVTKVSTHGRSSMSELTFA